MTKNDLKKLLELFGIEEVGLKQLKTLLEIEQSEKEWIKVRDLATNKKEGYHKLKAAFNDLTEKKGLLESRKVTEALFEYRLTAKAKALLEKFLQVV